MSARISSLLVLLLAVATPETWSREWTDATGKYQVEAELLGVDNDTVRLRKQGGREISIPLEKLSAVDQYFIEANKAARDEEPPELVGKVIGITDGDTITVLVDNTSHKVRLEGIDCPEPGQSFASVAKTFTSTMCFGKQVTVNVTGKDRYNRTLGEVVADGKNVNRELVSAGLAWWYHKYSDEIELAKLHVKAREENLGLWNDKKPIPPWKWRRLGVDEQLAHLSSQVAMEDEPHLPRKEESAGYLNEGTDRADGFSIPVVPKTRGPPPEAKDADDITVYVTRTGSKYHRSVCRYLRKSRIPLSLDEAKQRYSPCSVCNPPLASADTSFVQPNNRLTSRGHRPQGRVAENGSYYGEISTLTGRPKTNRVRGYYRKDGTYVRGHYRSR